ncbi:glycosyltransferase family 4 protein [Aestuariicoccus sp. MJ-SS9]|uniref:glycosyltransferase family 4 protein n=1 Tax=Aestuariicoccus sp. MJ-SS9 TaxID=3079855 RepID=UPI002931F59B|nr:glycosyltransferase family 4 protein [Aestuariicoccus sp. MJ-SS9]
METYSLEMAAGLGALGFDVDVVALPGRRDGGAPGIGALITFGLREGLRLLFRRHSKAVIFGGDLAIWPLVWAGRTGSDARPVIAVHGTDIGLAGRRDMKGRIYAAHLWLGRLMLPDAKIVANSVATAERLRAQGYADVTTVPLGCRVSVAEPEPGLDRTLLFAGRLATRKGLSWFVEAVLPHLPTDMRLVVVGTRWDKSEDAVLSHPCVDFLGPLPQRELHRKMAGALAVVIPNVRTGKNHFEGFGLIAAESAAAGGLVLASALDGHGTSVIDGETGRLLPPGDAKAWIAAIEDVAALPPEERQYLKTRARDTAQRHFDWARTASLTAELFR